MKKIGVGIIGFGRSGCGIHANALAQMRDRFDVVAICDLLPERRSSEKFPQASPCASAEELLNNPAVELVVVSTFNYTHSAVTIQALRAGKHVLCEKPFGLTVDDVDAMITAAAAGRRVLQPFQQRRYEQDFQKILKICRSGILGRLTHVKITWSGFNRRWDWQTSRQYSGGQLYNNCPHLVDFGMVLLGNDTPEIWCDMKNSLSAGDAEDEVKILLRAPGAPTVELELFSTCAYPQEKYLICGTAGTLRSNDTGLEWKYVDWNTMPERKLDLTPTENRTYNRETLNWKSGSWQANSNSDSGAGAAPASLPVMTLYSKLYDTICTGAPQEIPPEVVRTRIAVLQKCAEMSRDGLSAELQL